MENNNPYQAPSSDITLDKQNTSNDRYTIEEVLEKGYDFSIVEVLTEAFAHISGTKLAFFFGMLTIAIVALLLMLLQIVVALVTGSVALSSLLNFIVSMITTTLTAGFAIIALKKIRGQFEGAGDFFSIFNNFKAFFIPNIIISILMFVVIVVVAVIARIIFGGLNSSITTIVIFAILVAAVFVFLQVNFSMVYYIVIDHENMSPIQVIMNSFKLVKLRFLKILGVFAAFIVLSILVTIALVIVTKIISLILGNMLGAIVFAVLFFVASIAMASFYYLTTANVYNSMFKK